MGTVGEVMFRDQVEERLKEHRKIEAEAQNNLLRIRAEIKGLENYLSAVKLKHEAADKKRGRKPRVAEEENA